MPFRQIANSVAREITGGACNSFAPAWELDSKSRLADTWNSFAGVAPFDDLKAVKKFKDRKVAVARILSLYAAFNTKTGEIFGKTAPRHTSAEFVAFLTDIVANQPNGKEIHVIAERCGT